MPRANAWGERRLAHAALCANGTFLCAFGAHAAAGTPVGGCAAAIGAGVGLALAAQARLGRVAALATLPGLALALLARGCGPFVAVAAMLFALVPQALTARALARGSFDARLWRPRDVAWLVTTAALVALAAALSLDLASPLQARGETSQALAAPSPIVLFWLGLASLLLCALPACSLRRIERPLPAARLLLRALLALGVLVVLAAPSLNAHPQTQMLAWTLPILALIGLWTQGGTAVAASVLALTAWGLGLVTVDAAAAVRSQALALVLALLGTLLVAHASRADSFRHRRRWEWALDGSRLGVADWRLNGADSFVSPAWRTLTGVDAARWSPQAWLDGVHAEDRAALQAALDQVGSGETGRHRIELRMLHGAEWRWFEATLLVIDRDAAGTPLRLLATLLDVHERHQAQERQRLSASLFQHLHEGLLITDAELHVLDVNPAYAQILGLPREQLIGSVPSLLRPAPADPLARQQRAAMWAALRENGTWRGELLERRCGGEVCTLQVTISTIRGAQGELRNHVLVITDVSEQRAQRERLERQAHFDELTRLPNRARLTQLLAEGMRAADRDGYLLVVCYLDLDRFKPVNDRFGHAAGDRLLTELAGRLRSALRTRDNWSDSAARLGGDEFVLLLRAGSIEEARMAVDRVLRVVAQPYVVDPAQEPVQVTASVGASVYPIDRSDADTLLRHADHAMFGAKQSGRNGFLFFDAEHRRRTEERAMFIGRVQQALDQAEFVLHYQPKVDMRAGRVLGFEALLRWEHPLHGLIAPAQFLPQIENTGLSSHIGDWVFSQALEHLSQWRRSGLEISVSVNVSARHLQEPDFAQRLSELLARHSEMLAPHFELEMLETAAHADIEATSALLARCRAIGVRVALDDFGTGYSTLTYLKRLPVDVLKVDRSFVHHMLDDTQDRAIVEGVIGLARTFDCTVVAEGVESPAQARALLEMGCDIGQGTGIAAPMPAAQVAGFARGWRGMFALAPTAGGEGGAAAGATRMEGGGSGGGD
ncbi:MAG: diguanylate cyclase [Rubrivivax sp. SCN 71-131]|jgi:diguanylate cyclase (GGDEF)-like protein/PAS domain S-box-containing protein|nr:MAG: diguanylate cyclase [Rubrivivax sp. SCN 71-131]